MTEAKTILTVATGFAALSVFSPAFADTSDILHYMNPIPKKQGYLNQSQDRVIKRKGFKSVQIEGAQPIPNMENGLFAIVSPSQITDQAAMQTLLDDPRCNGLSVMLPWNMLEPEEAKFQWQPIDNLLSWCKEKNKSVILRVSTCGEDQTDAQSDTPKWVFDAGAKSVAYSSADGKERLMPIYWDPTYLAKWSNFVNALGQRYDSNSAIHSVGITGGGVNGGTAILPSFGDKARFEELQAKLKADDGLTERKLVQNWKYIADLFPQAFKTARLNFDIDALTPNRAGENSLDEISDYLVYRYGERIYLTRHDVANAKHGFDQYRILVKFRPDTLSGYVLTSAFPPSELEKLEKNALEDGISFAEIPAAFLTGKDQATLNALDDMRAHMGYQVITQKVVIPSDIKSGAPLKASFSFINIGSVAPMRPNRSFDKDTPSSYKVQLELRDPSGKAVVQSLHTPAIPTQQWETGKPITWEEELKMPKLQPGMYSVWLSLIDADTKRKLQVLNGGVAGKPEVSSALDLGKIQVSE